MSAILYTLWAVTIFTGGYLHYLLNPVVGQAFQDFSAPVAAGVTTAQFLEWTWDYGVLIIILIAPTIWLWRELQKRRFR